MIVIALGANLDSKFGSPLQTLAAAKLAIEQRGIKILKSSRTWLTAPVPVSDQPWYHNGVIAVHTLMQPGALLTVLHEIELDFGRIRHEKNAPRVLDLDLISYNDVSISNCDGDGGMTLPHPEMHKRAFVLLPLADIAQEWVHPVSGQSLVSLICALPDGQSAKPVAESSLSGEAVHHEKAA